MLIKRSILRSESGVALIKALIVSAAILVLTTAGLVLSRNDYVITGNVLGSRKALWTAVSGSETAKDWLFQAGRHQNLGLFPARLPASGTTHLAEGYDYAAEISIWDPDGAGFNDRFQIRSTSTGPDLALKTVEEIVQIAGLRFQLSPINIHGTTSHAKLGDGGARMEIPNFTVDGRDFDRTGKLSANPCIPGNVRIPIAGPADQAAQTTARREAKELKCGMIAEAQFHCNADGSAVRNNRTCTPGLHWIRSATANQSLSPNTNHADCSASPLGPACCLNLNLAAPELRATSHTIGQVPDCTANPGQCPVDPKKRGPLTADVPGTLDSFYQEINLAQLQAVIDQILDFGIAASNNVSCLDSDVRNRTLTFGTMPDAGAAGPEIVVVPRLNSSDPRLVALSQKACSGSSTNNLEIRDGTLEGTGILVVGRRIDINRNGLLHWRGLIVVMSDGDIRVEDASACGAVYGAIILKDGNGADPKITFNNAGPSLCTNPFANDLDPTDATDTAGPATVDSFSVNYSCEAINAAFTLATRTIAWHEDLSY